MTNASDLLASESLLFTVLGVIFSVWYPEISKALETVVPEHLEDADAQRLTVKDAFLLKTLPLAAADIVVALLFLPDTVSIVVEAIQDLAASGIHAVADYDAVRAALLAVTLLAAILAAYLVYLALALNTLRRKLRMK